MIWVLDDAGDTASDLLKRLQMFAHPVAEASGINISFNADDTARDTILSKTEKRNLLLIAKEAINNSIKYAESKNITLLSRNCAIKMYLLFKMMVKALCKIKLPGKRFKQYTTKSPPGTL
jgi:signal transduction histidine kinase